MHWLPKKEVVSWSQTTLVQFILPIVTFILLSSATRADEVRVTVDKTAQRLTVEVDGVNRYQWPISTARRGYRTPNGSYQPEWLARKWFSRQYDWSPMPYSIFFSGGYAIHGSYEISHLGSPASHGCIRLHPDTAAVLFVLVKNNIKSTQIVVTGESSNSSTQASRTAKRSHRARKHRRERLFFY